MAGFTNKGKAAMLDGYFRATGMPTVFYLALVTDTSLTADTNTKADITEVANGNGYTTGGISVARDGTDFDVLTEDDTNDRGLVQIKNQVWTASGGAIPASGSAIDHAILTDDNVTDASREIIVYWDLTGPHTVSDTQTFTLIDLEIRGNES